MKVPREMVLFGIGGVFGLLIDAGIVQLLVGLAGWNAYGARVVSFLAAASFTWWWNRRHTFADRSSGRSAHAEWLHWVGLMSVGAVINYGIYVLCLILFPVLHRWPAVAAAAGSTVAAVANFAVARGVLFKAPKSAV
jgi:putative flippase GtrA